MKQLLLFGLVSIGTIAFGQLPPKQPPPITGYRQIISTLPTELRKGKATAWTAAQRDLANKALQAELVAKKPTVKMKLKVREVADWPKLTLFAEVRNSEGHHIRVFAGFDEKWRAQLSALPRDTTVEIEGQLTAAKYGKVWGDFTLSICAADCLLTSHPYTSNNGLNTEKSR